MPQPTVPKPQMFDSFSHMDDQPRHSIYGGAKFLSSRQSRTSGDLGIGLFVQLAVGAVRIFIVLRIEKGLLAGCVSSSATLRSEKGLSIEACGVAQSFARDSGGLLG